MPSREEVYARYEALRDKKGLTDYAVAKDCQIGRSTFADWKAGRSIPRAEKLAKIAAYFGVSLEELYNGAEEKDDDPTIKELFSLAQKATPEQRAQAVRIFHALIGDYDGKDNYSTD